jgi:aspartyl-tRNA(Asn)/glutamyl-tRNA(Gln) amidotransferase subunit A
MNSCRKSSLLDGISYSLKGNISIKNQILSANSESLKNFTSPYDSDFSSIFKRRGLIYLGSSSLDEFAMGSFNKNSYKFIVKNPINFNLLVGGSSGGSCSSVSSNQTLFSVGSDTGGSVRQPAYMCGIIGFKPSYGTFSRYGLISFSSSIEQLGLITKSIKITYYLTYLLSTGNYKDYNFCKNTTRLKVGSFMKRPRQSSIGLLIYRGKRGFKNYIRLGLKFNFFFKNIGFKVTLIKLPLNFFISNLYYIISSVEAFSNLSRFDGVRYQKYLKTSGAFRLPYESYISIYRGGGLGLEVKKRLLIGSLFSSTKFNIYSKLVYRLSVLLKDLFNIYSFLVYPVYMECNYV